MKDVRSMTVAARITIAALIGCGWLPAQDRPQLVWEGEVDGISILSFRGNRVSIEDRQGLPVQRQRFRFFERLPDSRQDVRLEVREGRGAVRILQQPRLDNNYTLVVSIEDRQGGSSFYSLEFYWRGDRGFFGRPEVGRSSSSFDSERLTWTGRVDDEAVIDCRGSECRAESMRGGGVTRDRFRFSRPLPNRDVTVSLEDVDGRGEVRLLQQPREENGYTARVRIRDSQGGAGDYSFTLAWARPSRAEESFARRGMVWSGRVDGRIRVIIQGDRVDSEVITGAPVSGERATFSRSLPARNLNNATVRRLHGRGRVEIVEYPSNRNGYRLVFEINDTDGGADSYEVEVDY